MLGPACELDYSVRSVALGSFGVTWPVLRLRSSLRDRLGPWCSPLGPYPRLGLVACQLRPWRPSTTKQPPAQTPGRWRPATSPARATPGTDRDRPPHRGLHHPSTAQARGLKQDPYVQNPGPKALVRSSDLRTGSSAVAGAGEQGGSTSPGRARGCGRTSSARWPRPARSPVVAGDLAAGDGDLAAGGVVVAPDGVVADGQPFVHDGVRLSRNETVITEQTRHNTTPVGGALPDVRSLSAVRPAGCACRTGALESTRPARGFLP